MWSARECGKEFWSSRGEVEQTKLLSTETAQESSQAFEAEKKAWDEEKIAMQKEEKSLTAAVNDIKSRLNDALQQVTEKNIELAKAEDAVIAVTSTSEQVQTALEATIDENDTLKKQLIAKETEVSECNAKTDALSNKISRLKALLQRSKELCTGERVRSGTTGREISSCQTVSSTNSCDCSYRY